MADTKAVAKPIELTEKKPAPLQRKQRVPVSGPRDILTLSDKDPNYFYRWVKDSPGRVQRFLDAGYEIVKHDAQVGERTVDSGSRLGSALTRQDGGAVLVAMRIPLEWYNEDQEAKQRILDAKEDALRGETKIDRGDKWQPEAGFVSRGK